MKSIAQQNNSTCTICKTKLIHEKIDTKTSKERKKMSQTKLIHDKINTKTSKERKKKISQSKLTHDKIDAKTKRKKKGIVRSWSMEWNKNK